MSLLVRPSRRRFATVAAVVCFATAVVCFATAALPLPGTLAWAKAPAKSKLPAARRPAPAEREALPSVVGPAAALLHSIRAEMLAANRESRPSDLAALLLSATVESSFTMMLHSVYAVGATGQALRTGGVSGKDAAVVAKDVGHNLTGVALTWAEMAKNPAFAGVGAEAMTLLVKTAGHGVAAARALQTWAETPDAGTRAGAFEQAHETWRSSVAGLARALRGPESEGGKAEPAPPPPPAP